MSNIVDIEIAKQELLQASWWGGSGKALPEIYVEQLFTEIKRLNKAVDQRGHRIGQLESKCSILNEKLGMTEISLDHKTTLLHSCERALESRDEKQAEMSKTIEQLQEFKNHYSDMARANGFGSITAMAVKVRQLMNLDSPGCHHCDDSGDIHAPDGEWLGYCDCAAGIQMKEDKS